MEEEVEEDEDATGKKSLNFPLRIDSLGQNSTNIVHALIF